MAKKPATSWLLGQRIRHLRQSRGLTMKELTERAEKLGFRLPWRTLSDLERGERKDPQLSTLLAIAGGLGVELSRLVQVLDQTHEPDEEEPTMRKSETHVEALRRKITHKDSLIRKWTKEAEACDPTDDVGRAVQRYCRGLARWQQEERNRLEGEMRNLVRM
ncbi:MAG TPA: helix-turn-helix transcriptional regulator [Gemmataceae bacterium]|jgi:transcriptional regulator with XRE-family HTH domain